MKTLLQSVIALGILSAPLTHVVMAEATTGNPLVNAYGEPVGFGNQPEVIIPMGPPALKWSNTLTDVGGLYVMPGYVDPRNFESSGMRQARLAEVARGTVTIGSLEVLDSGPTGPMTPEARAIATDEVTAQVLARIGATDRIMASLRHRSKDLDGAGQTRFQTVAAQVAERRQALRESLKAVRAANGDQWSSVRSAVADNFNAYVQSTHLAEGAVSATASIQDASGFSRGRG